MQVNYPPTAKLMNGLSLPVVNRKRNNGRDTIHGFKEKVGS